MHPIHVLASDAAEMRATIPRLLDIFRPRHFKTSDVKLITNAEQLLGLMDIVVIELDGWKSKSPRNQWEQMERDRIWIQLQLSVSMGRVRFWLKECDYFRRYYNKT